MEMPTAQEVQQAIANSDRLCKLIAEKIDGHSNSSLWALQKRSMLGAETLKIGIS